MKIPYFFILTACAVASNVYAVPRQPPVLDDSSYNDPVPTLSTSQPLPRSYDDNANLEKLQNEISELKNRVQEQDEAIINLKRSNTDLQKKITGTSKTTEAEPKAPPSLDAAPKTTTSKAAAKSPAPATPDLEKNQYQRGSDLLKKGDYVQAIDEFKDFITAHPSSKYADNAQYWIAVALLNKGDKNGAIKAFDSVARTYPDSEKVPDALFKLGDTLLSMKNKAKAKEYFDYVIQNHPGTEGAKLAAKKKAAAKL